MREICLTVFFVFVGLQISGFGQEQEYHIKAVFLEQFTRFIEWPDSSAVSGTSTPFIITVIGENPFGEILNQIYAQQKIKNKRVEIHYISTINEMPDCHLLYISRSAENMLPEILMYTGNKPILTISDTKGFAESGVIINFYLSFDNIKFEINERAVHESGLAMSYRLLNLARIVNSVRVRQ